MSISVIFILIGIAVVAVALVILTGAKLTPWLDTSTMSHQKPVGFALLVLGALMLIPGLVVGSKELIKASENSNVGNSTVSQSASLPSQTGASSTSSSDSGSTANITQTSATASTEPTSQTSDTSTTDFPPTGDSPQTANMPPSATFELPATGSKVLRNGTIYAAGTASYLPAGYSIWLLDSDRESYTIDQKAQLDGSGWSAQSDGADVPFGNEGQVTPFQVTLKVVVASMDCADQLQARVDADEPTFIDLPAGCEVTDSLDVTVES